MTSKQKPFTTPFHLYQPPVPTDNYASARFAAPPRFSSPFSSKGMSLPLDYLEEIDRLNQKVVQAQPADILQFCANYFNSRLEDERIERLQGSPKTPPMSNPFGSIQNTQESLFPGSLGGNSVGLGMSTFDGTREAIREEDEEVHSPTTANFLRPHRHGHGYGRDKDEESASGSSRRSRSGRRSQSPGGRDASGTHSGSHRHRPHRSAASGSPFHSPAASHLSPNTAQGDFPGGFNMNRRTSVSAESLVPTSSEDEFVPPVHPKTLEQETRLRSAVAGNFLFSRLDDDQFTQVMLALVEKPIPGKDTRVITQGDAGDYFYVVEKGDFDIYVNSQGTMLPGPDGMGKKVASIGPGGSFGELALMYNAPRAATVMSTTPQNVLWALDRVTFRRILMENTFKKRRMYESFLEEVSLLSSLVAYERSKIADALDTTQFEEGETIIKEGDPGDRFYIMEQGQANVVREDQGVLRSLTKGDYFGELALLNDAPRAASVIAQSKVKVAFLDKDGFQRLLGPVVEIMRRNDPRLASNAGHDSAPPGLDGPVALVQESANRNRAVEA